MGRPVRLFRFLLRERAFLPLFLLAFIALFAPLITFDQPVFCMVRGHYYAPAFHAFLGLPSPGPFGEAGAEAGRILASDPDSFALWPPFRLGPTRTYREILAPPSRAHPLGTDGAGRDLFAQVIHGSRISLFVALLSGFTAFLLGVPLGCLAGMAGGWTDRILSRSVEVLAAFPSIFLVLAVMAWRGPDLFLLGFLLGATRWVNLFRFTRAEFMRLKERDYVLAARALGMGGARIAFSEILPNAWGAVLVPLAFLLSGSVLLEAGLTWIGLGVPPTLPSWGHMLKAAQANLFHAPHLLWPPAAALVLTVLAWNHAGEALRKRLE